MTVLFGLGSTCALECVPSITRLLVSAGLRGKSPHGAKRGVHILVRRQESGRRLCITIEDYRNDEVARNPRDRLGGNQPHAILVGSDNYIRIPCSRTDRFLDLQAKVKDMLKEDELSIELWHSTFWIGDEQPVQDIFIRTGRLMLG